MQRASLISSLCLIFLIIGNAACAASVESRSSPSGVVDKAVDYFKQHQTSISIAQNVYNEYVASSGCSFSNLNVAKSLEDGAFEILMDEMSPSKAASRVEQLAKCILPNTGLAPAITKCVGEFAKHGDLMDTSVDLAKELVLAGGDLTKPMVLFRIFLLLHSVGKEVYENREELLQLLDDCGYFAYLAERRYSKDLEMTRQILNRQVAGERKLSRLTRHQSSRKNLERSNSKGSFRVKSSASSQSRGQSRRR